LTTLSSLSLGDTKTEEGRGIGDNTRSNVHEIASSPLQCLSAGRAARNITGVKHTAHVSAPLIHPCYRIHGNATQRKPNTYFHTQKHCLRMYVYMSNRLSEAQVCVWLEIRICVA